MRLVEDLLDREEFDEALLALVERLALIHGIAGEGKGDDEAAGAVLADHGGPEGVDVGAVDALWGIYLTLTDGAVR